ncbi:MAG: DUF3822 family protein [Bacteroidota bacterium]
MSNQNSILLIDPAFDPTTSVNCSLLIKIGIDSFSYAILNKDTNKISAVFNEQECMDPVKKLSDRLKSDSYLSLTYTEVKLAIYTENNISIPNELFNSSDLALNASFFTQAHAGNLYTTSHPNFGFKSVFSFSKITEEIINQLLASSKKFESNAALLKLAENIAGSSILLDFTAGSIQVLYQKDKQVIFQQCYEIENVEEFNYYLLLMIDQLKINLIETPVYVSGIIHEGDEKFNCLSQYFAAIKFLDFVDFNLDQQVLEDMPSHYYTSLLALDQCE